MNDLQHDAFLTALIQGSTGCGFNKWAACLNFQPKWSGGCSEELLALIKTDGRVCVSLQNPHWQSWPCLPSTSSPAAALLPPPLLPLSLPGTLSVRSPRPGPLVGLMDDSAASGWHCISYPAASLVPTRLSESSGSAVERLTYLLTWFGSTTTTRSTGED